MRRQPARTPHEVRGLKFEVEGTALVCSNCGFQMIPADLLEEHGRLVDEAYRSAAGLLSAKEIRAARSRMRMSQQQFAEYLGVGEASVKRWEAGALPEKSSDDLIRLKTDPEFAQRNLEELCRRLGRKSPTETASEIIYVTVPSERRPRRFGWRTEGVRFSEGATLSVCPDATTVN